MATEWLAEVEWIGGLIEGEGRLLTTTSGLVPELEITWSARTDETEGKSSPEELLAAAHAADFSMQLAHGLVGAGWEPEEMQVSAKVSYESGIGITGIELTASVTPEGIPDELLRQVAERAKATCPISKALAGVEITLNLPDLPPPEEEELVEEEEYASVSDPDEE
ncbi:MAG TPA: OsmC family peroxiredoxin [Gaiellaceae bacterium]|jgi:osmotically inducible protein OsmC